MLSAAEGRGNVVIHRGIDQSQGDDNGHVGRPCEVSLAPPCPELFCELRGLSRHSYFGPRTCSRSEKPRSSIPSSAWMNPRSLWMCPCDGLSLDHRQAARSCGPTCARCCGHMHHRRAQIARSTARRRNAKGRNDQRVCIFVPELCCRGFSWRGFKTPKLFSAPNYLKQ